MHRFAISFCLLLTLIVSGTGQNLWEPAGSLNGIVVNQIFAGPGSDLYAIDNQL